MKTIGILFIYILTIGLVGYGREKFFIDINYLYYYKYYHEVKPWLVMPADWVVKIFNFLSLEQLYFLKYPFTLIFSLIFFMIGALFLRILNKKNLIIYYAYFYGILFGTALILTLLGVLIWNQWDSLLYHFSRRLVGIEQSPVPVLLIFAASNLSEKFGKS